MDPKKWWRHEGTIGALVVLTSYDPGDEPADGVVEDEGVGKELKLEESAGFESESPGNENGDGDI